MNFENCEIKQPRQIISKDVGLGDIETLVRQLSWLYLSSAIFVQAVKLLCFIFRFFGTAGFNLFLRVL